MRRHLVSFIAVTVLFSSTMNVSSSGSNFNHDCSVTYALKRPGGSPVTPQTKTVCPLPPSRKIDEYSNLSPADEKARLEQLVAILKAEPEDTKAFIVAYGGRNARPAEALERARRIKAALREMYFFYQQEGINTLNCGYRNDAAIEFWITPIGAAPPVCSPTINRSEVLIKPRVVRRAR